MQKRTLHHHTYYIIEFLLLLFGFFLIVLFSTNFSLQLTLLLIVLFSYTVLGLIHHHAHHDLKAKIMVEYILVSSLILAAFLFLNSGKL